MQAEDKKISFFLRPQKCDGTSAWDVLCRFTSFERPEQHKLIAQLTSIENASSERLVVYLTIADNMHYNLTQ